MSEINDYINEITQKINERIQDMRDILMNSIEIIESIGDIDLIIKQLDLSFPLKIP